MQFFFVKNSKHTSFEDDNVKLQEEFENVTIFDNLTDFLVTSNTSLESKFNQFLSELEKLLFNSRCYYLC